MFRIITLSLYNVQFSLWMMVQGMLGIFIFMAVFYGLIYALERIFKPRAE